MPREHGIWLPGRVVVMGFAGCRMEGLHPFESVGKGIVGISAEEIGVRSYRAQRSLQYSAMVRSEENLPAPAMLLRHSFANATGFFVAPMAASFASK